MGSPPINKRMDALLPDARKRLEAWMLAANKAFPQLRITIGETRRTLARQQWLFAQGRTRRGLVVTYTLDSNHRLGCAADFVIVRRLTPWSAIWDSRVWNTVFERVPPARYGLERLSFEMPHLQIPQVETSKLRAAGRLVQT